MNPAAVTACFIALIASCALSAVSSCRKDRLIDEQHSALEAANTALDGNIVAMTEAHAYMTASAQALSTSNAMLRQCHAVLATGSSQPPPITANSIEADNLCDSVVDWTGSDWNAKERAETLMWCGIDATDIATDSTNTKAGD